MTSYEDREITLAEGGETLRLVDFIFANLRNLSEGEVLNLESIQVRETVTIGQTTLQRIK